MAVAFLLVSGTAVRAAIIVAAAVTDYLDGWWARTRGPRTRTGEVLDPIADKVFVVTALIAFVVDGALTPAAFLVLLARDLFVTTGVLVVLALRLPLRLRARFPGKLVTGLQIAAVLVLTLVPRATLAIVTATLLASAWAIADYAIAALRHLRAPGPPQDPARRLRSPPPPR